MKKILPFKGILYNQDKITSMTDVVTPPYDVISPELQGELYGRSDFNFCRLDLPQETGEERYSIAKDLFSQWIAESILSADEKPAIYIHHQTFTLPDGEKVTRKGFFAARRIEEFSEGGIKPHEKTLEGPKVDRLNMTRATQTNLSPVFSLYSDPDKTIQNSIERLTQTTPSLDFVTAEGERHELWKCTDPEICELIDKTLVDKPLFIADGHHRYETALNYRNEILEQGELDNSSSANFLLMYFSNMNDSGLVILPIHRALHNLSGFSMSDLLEKFNEYFEVQKVSAADKEKNLSALKEAGEQNHAFWLLTDDPSDSYLIKLDRQKWLDSDLAKSLPPSLIKLDVTVLHQLIFNKVLGLSEESQARQENIIYWKSTEKAIAETEKGNCDLTFILNPTRIEDMETVALSGEKMPQKSTFFYPKIISGLVLHSVKVDEKDG